LARKKSEAGDSPATRGNRARRKADTNLKGRTSRRKATPRQSVRKHALNSAAVEKGAPCEQDQLAVNKSFPVVGIGASAGGLEAFRQLLKHLPGDTGMAFVLVQHLDPTHKSILTELLSRSTRLPVIEVEDGTRVEPDHVYVMPPNTSMGIAEGVLRLQPREEGRAGRHPVDYFLRTLSQDQSHRAIGVILSGTDSDGTLGLEAIKAEGGINFAQDAESAKYDGMPRSAAAAGHVDFVLTPEGIAKELARISRHPYVAPAVAATAAEEAQPTGRNGFGKILAVLRKAKRVDFTDYKANTLHRRISRRIVLNKLESMEDYARYLRENGAEVEALYQDILINVTSFFRNPETFEVLKERIFPQIVEQRTPDGPIRIWTLGCSTGEEAYSIAISFVEFTGDRAEHIPVQIFATDLSDKGIEKARTGLYSKDLTEDVSPERLRRFFTEADGGYRVSKPIRDMVVFARQNVLADPPLSRLDLISCRNLLIYLEPVLQKRLLPMLHYALKPTGVLWLGSSETVGSASDLFMPEEKKHRFYSKKLTAARMHFQSARGDAAHERAGAGQKTNYVSELRGEHDAQKEADRILLARYSPAGVVINAEMEILQVRGSTGAYLESPVGKATLNLLKMAREGLMLPLRAAIQKATKADATIRKEGVRVNYDGEFRQVNLEVIPIKGLVANERNFLVLFEPDAQAPRLKPSAPGTHKAKGTTKRKTAEDRHVARLQQELAATREYMQSLVEQHEASNEELQSANEEIQSSNEELQSINEEMETAKEELESGNEELATLNDELQNRNLELTILNDDQINLFSSVSIPIVMLGGDLRIRRFTPRAEKVLGLISTDVGRPIGDIKPNISIPDLEALLAEVIDTVSVKEREVQDRQGRWYSMRVRPYKTLDNKIDGAVIVLLDIDALKQSAAEIREARDFNEAIIETIREPLIVLDENLRVRVANQSFYENFQVKPEETENCLFYDLGNHQWDIPALRTLLEEILPQNSRFQDFEVEQEFARIGRKTMLLNARRLEQENSCARLILLAIEDITERKRTEALLQETEERFRALVDAAAQIVWTTSASGEVVEDSPSWRAFTGQAYEQWKGLGWLDVLHLEDRERVEAWWRKAMTEKTSVATEYRIRHISGEWRWTAVRAVPLLNPDGSVRGWVGSNTDIDDVKRAQEERERLLTSEHEARQQAETANRLKDEFLATVSHELRTPLNAIMGWAHMLNRGSLDEKTTARAVEIIERSARAQNQLISDLLDVSRMIMGQIRFEMSAVELIPVIQAATDTIRPAADAKGVELRLMLDTAAGLVSGDAARLQQIVWNLLTNAVKFTSRNGHVDVRLKREDTSVVIIVSDNGEGISPEFLPHIFDRFRQAESTTTRQHGGLGLGLAIVRNLVELHGGTVRAASHGVGQGATFTVTFPLMAVQLPNSDFESGNEDAEHQSQIGHPPSAILAGLRVLVVDDEPDARELLSLALTHSGAEVRASATASEALEILDQWKPDVLVSDIGMPSEDGYSLIRKVRARDSKHNGLIPALALTGYASTDDAARALAAGYQTHMPKPVAPRELVAAVASLAMKAQQL
jgi:two-component system, chemotaxis family, CheB/CheR fusion protein